MPTAKDVKAVEVQRIRMDEMTVRLRGITGLYCHRMTAKAKYETLVGGTRKTTADKVLMRHDPRAEFLDSMEVMEGWHPNSHIAIPSVAIKKAMMTSSLTVSGVTKEDVKRLIFMPDEWVPVFGIPRIRVDITRLPTPNNPPDARSRAYFRDWGTTVTIRFAKPKMHETAVVALLYNAGIICGIGDFRQERGAGNYGTFEPWEEEFDSKLLDRNAQWEAIQNVEPDNDTTRGMLEEYDAEASRRA